MFIYRKLDYQASSPDEKALVEGCARVGILHIGETNDVLTLNVKPFRVSNTSTFCNIE